MESTGKLQGGSQKSFLEKEKKKKRKQLKREGSAARSDFSASSSAQEEKMKTKGRADKGEGLKDAVEEQPKRGGEEEKGTHSDHQKNKHSPGRCEQNEDEEEEDEGESDAGGQEDKKMQMSSIALEVLMAMSSIMRGINVITSFQQVMYTVGRSFIQPPFFSAGTRR